MSCVPTQSVGTRGWTFHDAATADGRSVLTFRTVELVGNKSGVLPLGPRGKQRVAVAWNAATNTVSVDADGDGKFSATEKHTLTDTPLEVKLGVGDATRTVLLRRRGDGLAHAVRGYMSGSLTLGGDTFPARLTDGNADGCFDDVTADKLWIDVNRDGKFDPLAEQFPLGKPATVNGRGYLVRPDPFARTVTAVERSNDTGSLRLDVSRLKGATVSGLSAQLVSEWGELVTVTDADTPGSVPVGRYRIESVQLRLTDGDGREWRYRFDGPDGFAATVRKGQPTALDLTAGAKVSATTGAKSADGLDVTPAVTTAAGLMLTGCSRVERFADWGPDVEATIDLEAPGSESVFQVRSGFF